ncbi:MAG: ectoine hydroxylase [Alphaproteobacteria bacterium]|nr:ectoine hydroxylase [Alphaproteobacteria bacterium]
MTTGAPREDRYPSRIGGHPKILPRMEPVVHAPARTNPPIDAGAIARYERDGFLVLESLLQPHEVEALVAAARDLLRAPDRLETETLIRERESQEVRSIFKIHAQSKIFAALAADPRIADIARFILDDDVYIHQSRLNYKPGFRGKEFYWHSDFETWHVEDGMPAMRALSASILLTDNSALNGPLLLVPGSHRHFVSCVGETPDDHYKHSLRRQDYGVPDDQSLEHLVAAGGIVAGAGKAGTVVLFDCNTMHGSNGNITPEPRSNAFFVYNAVSNRLEAPFGPPTPRPEFIAARKDVEPLERRARRAA